MAANGFFLAFLCGLAVMAGGLFFLKPLAIALGSTPTILPYTEAYLRIILMGAPFMTSSLVLNNQLRFQGSAAYAMVGIVTGAVINIVLDHFNFSLRNGCGRCGSSDSNQSNLQLYAFIIPKQEGRQYKNPVL